jgi:hypothetical protein
MYCHAFVESDLLTVVEKALLSLPAASGYARCIRDVISWWRAYPTDWHRCWSEVEKKWSQDVGCPECVLSPGNIDAKLNGAYIVIGLLYGQGDFGRTIEIAARCGQDSDCNPSNAGGILGALIGFSKIPDKWTRGVDPVETLKFSYSDYSLRDVYEVNYRLAAELVRRGGGDVNEDTWTIQVQTPRPPAKLEAGFQGFTPVRLVDLSNYRLDRPFKTSFTGAGFVVHSRMLGFQGVAKCEARVDGRLIETITLKGNLHDHRFPLFWNYDLAPELHELEINKLSGDGVPQLVFLVVYNRTGN